MPQANDVPVSFSDTSQSLGIDPLAKRLFDIGKSCQNRASADLPMFLALEQVFPASLVSNEVFTSGLARAYDGLAAGR